MRLHIISWRKRIDDIELDRDDNLLITGDIEQNDREAKEGEVTHNNLMKSSTDAS